MDEIAEERAASSRAWERSAESGAYRFDTIARTAPAARSPLGSATQITRCYAAFAPS